MKTLLATKSKPSSHCNSLRSLRNMLLFTSLLQIIHPLFVNTIARHFLLYKDDKASESKLIILLSKLLRGTQPTFIILVLYQNQNPTGCSAGAEFGGISMRTGSAPSLLDGSGSQGVLREQLGYQGCQGPSALGTQG